MDKIMVRWGFVLLPLLFGLACSVDELPPQDTDASTTADAQPVQDTSAAACTRGETHLCACAPNVTGEQLCGPSGEFGACDCTGQADASGDAQSPASDASPTTDAAHHDTAPQCIPSQEVCDGVDNNCDGVADEGCECSDGATQDCGMGADGCSKGTKTCSEGHWGACEGADLSCGTCGGCPPGKVCNNRANCVEPGLACEDRCDCRPGYHCTGGHCSQDGFGPYAPRCCTDTMCASGEGCVELNGQPGTCP